MLPSCKLLNFRQSNLWDAFVWIWALILANSILFCYNDSGSRSIYVDLCLRRCHLAGNQTVADSLFIVPGKIVALEFRGCHELDSKMWIRSAIDNKFVINLNHYRLTCCRMCNSSLCFYSHLYLFCCPSLLAKVHGRLHISGWESDIVCISFLCIYA